MDSPKNALSALPVEILTDIFDFLDVNDLTNMADTCTKFRAIARERFDKNHETWITDNMVNEMGGRTLAKFMRNFGEYFGKYELNCQNDVFGEPKRYVEHFFKYCGGPGSRLRSVKYIYFTKALRWEFSEQFEMLEKRLIELSSCHSDGIRKGFGRKSTGGH